MSLGRDPWKQAALLGGVSLFYTSPDCPAEQVAPLGLPSNGRRLPSPLPNSDLCLSIFVSDAERT